MQLLGTGGGAPIQPEVGGGTQAWRLGGGEADFPRRGRGLITQVMSPCELVVHRHVVVDKHALVVGSELSADFNPSTLSAHQMAPPNERTSMVDANGHAWVRLDTARGSYWLNLETGHTQWRPPWEH